MIYIIRHGQTDQNTVRVLQGRSNYPLNEEGRKEAEIAAEKLKKVKFSHVFSSPLVRAIETARTVVSGVNPIIDERLIEMDYGPYEGADLTNLSPELKHFFSDFVYNPTPNGMEPLSSVVLRVGAFLDDIKGLQGNILLATHAIAMKGILEYLTPTSNGSYWSKYIGNCAIYVVDNHQGQYGVPKEMKI